MSMPKADRHEVLAEGLQLLVEHIGTLYADLLYLAEGDRRRGAAVVDTVASEEAAKLLIILDIVRMGWDDEELVRRQLRRFYNHLARGMYARLYRGRPADLKEVCNYAEMLRPSHYLDGPNEVDWIFRNEIVAEREEKIYVDYMMAEDQRFWSTPARKVDDFQVRPSLIIKLALALDQVGATSIDGLRITSEAWHGVTLIPSTHWQEVENINRQIVNRLSADGLLKADVTASQVGLVYRHWTFPLGYANLEELKVDSATLQRQRDDWLARQWPP
jgi:hypothetical protein